MEALQASKISAEAQVMDAFNAIMGLQLTPKDKPKWGGGSGRDRPKDVIRKWSDRELHEAIWAQPEMRGLSFR